MRFNSVESVIGDIKLGKIVIVVDDKKRENEADLICSARAASSSNINFMAKYARGLICTPLSYEYAEKYDLHQMVSNNTDNHKTAFTISIDHIKTSTGISANDRSLTIKALISKKTKASDFRRPGHVFPLVANKGGILKRNGHTEATVALMQLANLEACGVCCEIMEEDGSMKKGKAVFDFAKKHNLKITSIKLIQEYVKKYTKLIEKITEVDLPCENGNFKAHIYFDKVNEKECIALVKESKNKDILCRVHSECLTGDSLGSLRCDCGKQLDLSLKKIDQNGGVLIYLRQEGRGIGLLNKFKAYKLQQEGYDTVSANIKLGFESDLREYYIAYQILKDLNISNIRLLTNNPNKIKELKKYGLKVERENIEIKSNVYDKNYLKVKKEKMKHMLKEEF